MATAHEQLASVLKVLGERNILLAKLRRQLDAVPGRSELSQYSRRFTELCAQGKNWRNETAAFHGKMFERFFLLLFSVNDKQIELNGYYLLYNTLGDTKVYLNKELSLLTSIHETFPQ